MIASFLWGYLCLTGIASVLIYCACLAAARADQIRPASAINFIKISKLNESAEMNPDPRRRAQLINLLVIEH